MRYADLFALLEAEAREHDIRADITYLELVCYRQLQRLVDQYDLPEYQRINDRMAVTSAGVEHYPLPGDFGRLLKPIKETQWGIKLHDESSNPPADLTYVEPIEWLDKDRTTQNRPGEFTLMDGQLWLNPVPDTNSASNYRIQGTYILAVERPEWDEVVRLPEPSVLISKTLAAAAGSKHPDRESLFAEAARDEGTLALNYNRRRVGFWHQDKHDRLGRGYGRG